MKTPISRYLTLVTAHRLDIILTGFRTHRTLDIVSGLQKTGIEIESRVGRERSNNAFSAETGHKFSRSSTRHDLVKPVGGREDERFDLTRISTCFFRSFAWKDWTILVPGVFWLWPRSGPGSCNYKTCHPEPESEHFITSRPSHFETKTLSASIYNHCVLYSCSFVADGIISNWSPGANIIVSCSDN